MNKEMQNKKSIKLLDFVVFDKISHHIMNKNYKWCYINIHTYEEVPTADPE